MSVFRFFLSFILVAFTLLNANEITVIFQQRDVLKSPRNQKIQRKRTKARQIHLYCSQAPESQMPRVRVKVLQALCKQLRVRKAYPQFWGIKFFQPCANVAVSREINATATNHLGAFQANIQSKENTLILRRSSGKPIGHKI